MTDVYRSSFGSDHKQFMSDEKVNILNDVSKGRRQDEKYYTFWDVMQ
jgi:hypothetical protein